VEESAAGEGDQVSRWVYGLSTSLPVYVTRQTASGETAQYSASLWATFLAGFLVWLNVVLWGIVGLIAAVGALL
jgi:hypothetical protein